MNGRVKRFRHLIPVFPRAHSAMRETFAQSRCSGEPGAGMKPSVQEGALRHSYTTQGKVMRAYDPSTCEASLVTLLESASQTNP